MLRLLRPTLFVSCTVLAAGLLSGSASADDFRRYSDDSRDYWNGYWGWYDGYYRPYYQRRHIHRPDYYYGEGNVNRGRGFDSGPRYRAYRPGIGVNVGPFSFQYWR